MAHFLLALQVLEDSVHDLDAVFYFFFVLIDPGDEGLGLFLSAVGGKVDVGRAERPRMGREGVVFVSSDVDGVDILDFARPRGRVGEAKEAGLGLDGAEGKGGLPVLAPFALLAQVDHVGVGIWLLRAAFGAVGVGRCPQSLAGVHYINKGVLQ